MRSLDAGADVVVEKPLTIDGPSAALIEDAIDRTGREVVITFNYRYSPRNSALRQVIQDGTIGEVTSVDFSWMLDTNHGADYFRRWHREKKNSGGLLIHKASHHFDLVNWWIRSEPRRVFASGGLQFYGADNAAARGIRNRPVARHDTTVAMPSSSICATTSASRRCTSTRRSTTATCATATSSARASRSRTTSRWSSTTPRARRSATRSTPTRPWEGYRVAVNGTEGRVELDVVERGAVARRRGAASGPRSERRPRRIVGVAAGPRASDCSCSGTGRRAYEVPIETATAATAAATRCCSPTCSSVPARIRSARPADWRDGVRSIAVGIAGNRSLETGLPVRVADLGIRFLQADAMAGR